MVFRGLFFAVAGCAAAFAVAFAFLVEDFVSVMPPLVAFFFLGCFVVVAFAFAMASVLELGDG